MLTAEETEAARSSATGGPGLLLQRATDVILSVCLIHLDQLARITA